MGKEDLRRRDGKFSASLRGRMAAIQALREWGWSWRQIAGHFAEDVGLGGASEQHFSTAWGVLAKAGVTPDRAEVDRLKRAMLDSAYAQDAWVRRRGAARVDEHAVAPEAVEARPAEPERSGVVERHRMSAAAAGVSSSFAVPARQEASPSAGAGGPLEYSDETIARLERRLLMAGDSMTAAEFMSELGFPRVVADAAVFEQRKVKTVRGPNPALTLFRRLAFSSLMHGKPDALAFVERLPGAAAWVEQRRGGVMKYEEAARLLGV